MVPLLSLLEKRLWIKHLFETQKTFASQLWVRTPVNFTPFQCVNKCPLGFTLDGKLIQTLRCLKLGIIDRGNLRTWLCRTYNQRPNCTIESYYTSGTQKKIDCFNVDGFCAHSKTVFEALVCYFLFCACQEAWASMSEEDTQRRLKKRDYDELRQNFLRNKGYKIVEM